MSSAGATGRWRCAGAPRAWSRPAPSSAGSTGICTFGRYAPPCNATPPTLSDPTATVTPKPPPEHRTAAEVPRRAGQPRGTGAASEELCSVRSVATRRGPRRVPALIPARPAPGDVVALHSDVAVVARVPGDLDAADLAVDRQDAPQRGTRDRLHVHRR